MKEITLKKLTAENFRGQSFDYTFGKVNKISGRNESGKSTVKNAFLWLLTGADEDDMTNKDLFDKRITQSKETSVPAIVTGILDVDGYEVELKRAAKMGWTRKRGEETWTRKGTDDYTFSIDSIDRSATDYKAWVEENIAPIDKLKVILNITQFIENIPDWKTQRKMLSDIVGEITNDDFKGDYTELFAELERYTPEQIRERIKNKLSPLKTALGSENKKGEKIVTLEVLESQLVDDSAIKQAEEEFVKLKEKRAGIQKRISGKRKDIEPLIEKRNEALRAVEEKKISIYALKREFQRQQEDSIADLVTKVRNAERENAEIVRNNKRITDEYNRKKQNVSILRATLKETEASLNELRKRNLEIKARTFDGENCAFCGQRLPEDKLAQAMADFEAAKEKERKANVEIGKQKKLLYESNKADLEALEKEIAEEPVLQPTVELEKLQFELAKARTNLPVFEDSDVYKKHIEEVSNLEKAVPEMPSIDTAELDEQLRDINDEIDDVSAKCGERAIYNRQVAQITKLKKELREMSAERAALEKIEQQLLNYEEEKANIIGARVNSLLEFCHVDMFAIKKDGELMPNCEVKMQGVGDTMNTASKIIAGMDISNAFCRHYDVSLPLFIDNFEVLSTDNAEHITSTERQLVIMQVSDNDLTFLSDLKV